MDDEPTIEHFEIIEDVEEDDQCSNATKVAAMAGAAALVASGAFLVTKKVREKLAFRRVKDEVEGELETLETSEETPQKDE